jgi:hypothetical protein
MHQFSGCDRQVLTHLAQRRRLHSDGVCRGRQAGLMKRIRVELGVGEIILAIRLLKSL